MDLISLIIIFGLVFILFVLLMLPAAFGIPLGKLIMVKLTKSMLILTLTPDKRLEAYPAKPKSSIIETRKGHLHFLNIPDAVYMMWGIPTAIAYHKYGAVLPMRNIIHATKMREAGFYNIGELKNTIDTYNLLLYGDKKTLGLYDQKAELEKALEGGNEEEGGERVSIEPLFSIPQKLESDLTEGKRSHELLRAFRDKGAKLSLTAKIIQTKEKEWVITTHKTSFRVVKEEQEQKAEEDEEQAKLLVYQGDKLPKEVLEDDLGIVNTQIKAYEEALQPLQEVEIEDQGIIKIQDIFNYLNKNLSTDVIFSVIERATAEELRDMRDFKKTFVDLFPYILTLFFGAAICYVIIMQVSQSGGIGAALSGIQLPSLTP